MDNKEKIRILKEMRELISNGVEGYFCPAYAEVTRGNSFTYEWVTEQMLNEIGLYKPEKIHREDINAWYARDNGETRLQKIDEAITKFENKMKNEFAVKVHNKYLSEAVQKLAFDNGYRWPIRGQIINLNETSSVLVFEEKEIRFLLPDDEYDYSALTDWDKIEQAMKPKEPRVIWVNEYSDIGLGGRYDTKEEALNSKFQLTNYIRTIKFQEVIE